jgi:hypothetical protein
MITLSTPFLLFALTGIIVVLVGWIIHMEIRLGKILRGKSGKDLEDTITFHSSELASLKVFQSDSIAYMKNIESRLKRSIQAVETIRFNPFKGTGSGGNQSFATSFLNEKGDGLVISSLYSRERVSVYAKPIKKLTSEFELTEEEKEATDRAKSALSHTSNNDK